MGFFAKLDGMDFLLGFTMMCSITIHILSTFSKPTATVFEKCLVVFIHTSLLVVSIVLVSMRSSHSPHSKSVAKEEEKPKSPPPPPPPVRHHMTLRSKSK